MNNIIKTTIPLFLICTVTGLCLSYVNSITKGPIQDRIKEAAEQKRVAVLKEAKIFEEIKDITAIAGEEIQVKSAFKGIDSDKIVGYVFVVPTKGYGGMMDITVGVDTKGSITGVKMGDNKETPGLGSKAGDDPFISQYTGKNTSETIELVKAPPSGNQVQAVSGATISSTAVTNAVNIAADCFNKIIKKGASEK